MKFSAIATSFFFAATVSAQAVRGVGGNCGFPGGPDCVAVGKNEKGQSLFKEPADSPGDDCCLFPLRCGNGDGVAEFPCVKIGGRAPAGKGKKANAKNAKNRKRRIDTEVEAEA